LTAQPKPANLLGKTFIIGPVPILLGFNKAITRKDPAMMPEKSYYYWIPAVPRPDKNILRMRRGPGHDDFEDDAGAVRAAVLAGRLEGVYPTDLPMPAPSPVIRLPLPERQTFGRGARLAS
jgi:hypothetical protein